MVSAMNEPVQKDMRPAFTLYDGAKIQQHWGIGSSPQKKRRKPNFVADRRLVVRNLFGYKSFFLEPDGFVPRFYHQIVDLGPRTWSLDGQTQLVGGFCDLIYRLTIYYQPSLGYAQKNRAVILEVHENIQTNYEGVLHHTIVTELDLLNEKIWLEKHYEEVEDRLAQRIDDYLARQLLVTDTRCELKATFRELPKDENGGEIDDHFMYGELFREIKAKSAKFDEDMLAVVHQEEQDKKRRLIELKQEALRLEESELEVERALTEMEKKKVRESFSREEQKRQLEANDIAQQTDHEVFKVKEQEREQVEKMQFRRGLKDKKVQFLKEELELLLLNKKKHILEKEVGEIPTELTEKTVGTIQKIEKQEIDGEEI